MPPDAHRTFLLQKVQPGLIGLIDGTISTLAPIFAAAYLASTHAALLVGLASALGAAISMGLSEGLSDDGTLTSNPLSSQVRFYRLLRAQAAGQAPGAPITFLPPSLGSAYLWNFGDGSTSTSNFPSHTFQADGLYTVTAVVTDASGSHTNTAGLQLETPAQILLTPQVLAGLRLKATNNTAQWQSFKSRLDGQLNVVIESFSPPLPGRGWRGSCCSPHRSGPPCCSPGGHQGRPTRRGSCRPPPAR
jgi:hypothetical protein